MIKKIKKTQNKKLKETHQEKKVESNKSGKKEGGNTTATTNNIQHTSRRWSMQRSWW